MRRLLVALVIVLPAVAAAAEATRIDRLKAGLRVQLPRDVAFCEGVDRLVREGRLPAQVVDGTYAWAVNRGRTYPFPAFEQALRIKAARLGVDLDAAVQRAGSSRR